MCEDIKDLRVAIVNLQTKARPIRARLAKIYQEVADLQTKETPLEATFSEIQGGIAKLRAECGRRGHVGGEGLWCLICGALIRGVIKDSG